MNDLTYLIVPSNMTKAMRDHSKTSAHIRNLSPRVSVDGKKAILKVRGPLPSWARMLPQYDHQQVLALLDSPEWTQPQPLRVLVADAASGGKSVLLTRMAWGAVAAASAAAYYFT